MLKLAATAATLSTIAATPETGCYFYTIPAESGLSVKAQIDIKNESSMDFSVYFDVPAMGLADTTVVCLNEPYEWNVATSTMIVGKALSPCLAALQKMTNNAVVTPLSMVYDAELNSLSTTIVIPITITKASECQSFTVTAPVEPIKQDAESPIDVVAAVDAVTTTTTKSNASTVGLSVATIVAMILAVSL